MRELEATSEALERRRDGRRTFASLFRNVAQARGENWGTDLPRFTSGTTSAVPTRSSPRRSRCPGAVLGHVRAALATGRLTP
jgi:hypothetical protein